jgi:hypothetical protein
LDSGPGVPLRESVAFAAAVVPMLLVPRFKSLGMSPESMVLAGSAVYLLVRFGVVKLFTTFTVHRGMFHSIPALAIVALLTYLICKHENEWIRVYMAGGVSLGFLSHLVLDEIWSIDFLHLRLKSSFGTAMKFWSDCWWSNIAVYSYLMVLALSVFQTPVTDTPPPPGHAPQEVATQPDDEKKTGLKESAFRTRGDYPPAR